jgi:hypothetical protein
MPKKSKNQYFTRETEDAIVLYNNTTDPIEKNKIYELKIHQPLFKLTQNIIHTFKFYYTEVDNIEHLQHELIIFALSKIHLYDRKTSLNKRFNKIITKEFNEIYNGDFEAYIGDHDDVTQDQINDFISTLNISEKCKEKLLKITPPKAFSYFGTIIKRWLINYNKENYKKLLNNTPTGDLKEADQLIDENNEDPIISEFLDFYISYVEKNFDKLFIKYEDKQIADAVLEVIRRRNSIDIIHKKALYLQIREILHINGITEVKSPRITKNTKKLYTILKEKYYEFNENMNDGY